MNAVGITDVAVSPISDVTAFAKVALAFPFRGGPLDGDVGKFALKIVAPDVWIGSAADWAGVGADARVEGVRGDGSRVVLVAICS